MVLISDEALALLGLLHSAQHLGTSTPRGFDEAFIELQSHGFASVATNGEKQITAKGEAALREIERLRH